MSKHSANRRRFRYARVSKSLFCRITSRLPALKIFVLIPFGGAGKSFTTLCNWEGSVYARETCQKSAR
jgi:hypothetical protein